MEKEKKQKLVQISLWVLLCVAILFVVITSCVIKYQKDKLAVLTNKNDEIEDKLEQMEDENLQIIKIF